MTQPHKSIAFIGGTGPEGLGLAMRFAAAGRTIVIGSRSQERAREAAGKVRASVPHAVVSGLTNRDAAAAGDLLIITVPYDAQAETLAGIREEAKGKMIIDTVVPLRFEKGMALVMDVPEGSAAQQAASLLPESRVAAAFHHLSAPKLMALEAEVPGDVLVCSDDPAAKAETIELAGLIKGCRGLDGGGLANAAHLEAFTAVLLSLNRTYKTRASFRVAGV